MYKILVTMMDGGSKLITGLTGIKTEHGVLGTVERMNG